MVLAQTLSFKQPPMVNLPAYELLNSFIQSITLSHLAQYTSLPFKESRFPADLQSGEVRDCMSIILLWGQPGIFTLKTHFNLAEARAIMMKNPNLPSEIFTDDKVRDFVKEFSNLQGGAIRRVLGANGVQFGMSLPFLALGSDEAVFRKVRDPRSFLSGWEYSTPTGEVLDFSLEMYMCDEQMIEKIRPALVTEAEKQADATANDANTEFELL